MKRNQFIKNLALTVGGSTLFACESDLIQELVPLDKIDKLDVNEARLFYENYLKEKSNNLKTQKSDSYKRLIQWEKAITKKNRNSEEFLSVSIEYEDKIEPGILTFESNAEYKSKLVKEFTQPIKETLIIFKKNKKIEMFLAQLSYDPFKLAGQNDRSLKLENMTGWMILSDLDNNPLRGLEIIDGNISRRFDVEIKNSKIKTCDYIGMMYQRVEAYYEPLCGCTGYMVTAGVMYKFVCSWSSGYQPVISNPDPNTTYFYYYNGLGYTYNPYITATNTYNPGLGLSTINNAVQNIGYARQNINSRISNVLSAMGIVNASHALVVESAEALAKSLGGRLGNLKAYSNGAGAFGIVVDGAQLVIGIFDGKPLSDNDAINFGVLALGISGFMLGGWIGFSIGAFTLYVSAVTN
jgi:hypothetical protein